MADGVLEIRIDDADLRRALRQLGARAEDGRMPLRAFYQLWRALRIKAWAAVKATGGTFLGKTWPRFADQYTRKTDGVTVPAWGGVARVARGFQKAKKWEGGNRRGVSTGARMKNVTGNVSGRLRSSGKRVTQSSVQMMDTGELRDRVLPPVAQADINKARLRLGEDLKPWEVEQITEREVLFWAGSDDDLYRKVGEDHLRRLVKEAGLA